MTAGNPQYLAQDSTQTLREGLAEYYALNPALLDPERMPAHAAAMFRQHDAAHVVFGCDTSMRGEVLIDTWTIFGTSIGLSGYLEYLRLPQVNDLFTNTGYLTMTVAMVRAVPDVVKVIWRSRGAREKWAWADWEQQLERPLRSIREQHGVRVV